ncbi:MAG: DUF4397 domain-containing protein [Capsulimonadales bacterium]|nr:DUF4397 domain-containing protein [Capsulimonadales bacterium]
MLRRSFLLVTLTTLFAASLAGCGSGNGALFSVEQSRLRVVHASPNAPAVDVRVDDINFLTNVPYRTASGYLTILAGNRNLKVNAAGTETTVINATANFAPNTRTTVLAVDRLARIEPLILSDETAAPTSGNIKLRLVHASPAAGPVDIYITAPTADLATATPTLPNVPFKANSGYLQVPAGSYRVRITPTGTKTVAIDTGTVTLTAGQVRTGVAIGDPGVGRPLEAILLADN